MMLEMNLSDIQISQSIYIKTKEWPPGTYCYRIVLDNFIQSGKMIKIF
jgi:hypothetical protein